MNKYINGKVYVWGTGVKANELNQFHPGELKRLCIEGYIDNNPDKWNKEFYGKKIFCPDVLLKSKNNYVYIANQYEKEIREQLKNQYSGHYEILDNEVMLRMQILTRYENCNDSEIVSILQRLEKKPLEVFNYDFVENYNVSAEQIFMDNSCGMYYVYYFGKKMYFSKKYDSISKVQEYYRSILLEQDKESPHCYLTEQFDVQAGAVVIDAGVAEGNFSVSIIDKVSKIYLFEPDKDWVEALNKTFENYMDKVVIINKCLSDYVNEYTTDIDSVIREEINFIKMDIEGEEYYALRGANRVISESNDFKCLICTYHQEFAYEAITQMLKEYGIEYETSKGYMWYPDGEMRPPILRRGIVRGIKK